MNKFRARLSADNSSNMIEQYDDSALEGVAANVKLLLKLIQDHKEACHTQRNDGRRMLRVAGMMTILDMVRTRIQKCQSFGNKRSEAKLLRCNTDLRGGHVHIPRDGSGNSRRTLGEASGLNADEKERLRKELNASLAARKSLEIMCSSLGKEKEIMVGELARKAHELSEMEEHINDIKEQNATLLEKVQECAALHIDESKKCDEKDKLAVQAAANNNVALQERNKALSEQLLRSLDGYRSVKRKLRELQEENMVMRGTIEEMGIKVGDSLKRIRNFKQRLGIKDTNDTTEEIIDIEEGISELEHMFDCFDMKVPRRNGENGAECGNKITTYKPVLA